MSIFEKKEVNFSTPILRERLNREKGISRDIKEMHGLKTGKFQKSNPDCYFSQSRFQSFLKIIIIQFAIELAKTHIEIYENDEIYVLAMELARDGHELWIKIEWKEWLSIEQYCLKANIQIGGIPNQFIGLSMKAAPNSIFPVPDRSPAGLIQRCNLRDGGLKELFFGDCTKIYIFSKVIELKNNLSKKEKQWNY